MLDAGPEVEEPDRRLQEITVTMRREVMQALAGDWVDVPAVGEIPDVLDLQQEGTEILLRALEESDPAHNRILEDLTG